MRFASGGEDGLIKIWDVNACSLFKTFELSQTIGKLTLIDGGYLASMTSEFKVWDLSSLTLKYSFAGGTNIDLGIYKLNLIITFRLIFFYLFFKRAIIKILKQLVSVFFSI